MTHTTHKVAGVVLAALAVSTTLPAFALTNGITPTDSNVINPINGQTLSVWKLVGQLSGGTSAFQIHRNWILSAHHTYPSGRTFTSPLGSSQIGTCINAFDHTSITDVSPDDFVLCPLVTPSGLADYGTYPALVAAPTLTTTNQGNFGALLAYGFGAGAGASTLAIVDFTGWPYQYNPALGFSQNDSVGTVPYGVPGDSGSPVYWLSPTANAPALVAVTTGRGPVSFYTPMSDTAVQWIRDKITQAGDVPPVGLLSNQHYTGTTANRAKTLDTPPTVTWNGSGVNVNWTNPANDSSVQQYVVTFGHDGVLERTQSVSFGTGNSVVVNNLAAGAKYAVCVRPKNAVGPSNAANPHALVTPAEGNPMPNCTAFDPRLPGTAGLSISLAPYGSGTYKATASWTAPAATPALTIGTYNLSQTVGYATGPKRTTSASLSGSTTSYTANIASGSQICITLTATTPLGRTGPQTTQCQTAP